MPVMDELVDVFRSYLSGDREQAVRRIDEIDMDTTATRIHDALLTAMFQRAVAMRLTAGARFEDVIELVADLRASWEPVADRLEPDATERMVAAVFDSTVRTDDISGNQSMAIRLNVLGAIIYPAGLDGTELEEFLDRSRARAIKELGR